MLGVFLSQFVSDNKKSPHITARTHVRRAPVENLSALPKGEATTAIVAAAD